MKPCPFCGAALVVREHSAFHPNTACYLTGLEVDEADYHAWNVRAALAPVAPGGDEATVERLRVAQALIDEQAADGGLWFIPHTAAEAYLMQELRKLHAAIEGKSPDDIARAALRAISPAGGR